MNCKEETIKKFIDEVYKRDNYTCRYCHFTYGINSSVAYLSVHHITDMNSFPSGGYVSENGISLCKEECCEKAEVFSVSGGLEWVPGMHPDNLYKIIGSSLEEAEKASEKLHD